MTDSMPETLCHGLPRHLQAGTVNFINQYMGPVAAAGSGGLPVIGVGSMMAMSGS